jgi:hypothetical protein
MARLVHEAPTGSSSTVAISHAATASPSAGAESGAGDPVTVVQRVLRAVASAAELDGAAKLLDDEYPALADVLRVYGTLKTADARAHYERTVR